MIYYRKILPVRPWYISQVAKKSGSAITRKNQLSEIPGPNFLATWLIDHGLTGTSLR